MGGLMKIFDLKRSRMARKVADKKHGGGFEDRRKEFRVESYHGFLSAQDEMLQYNYRETEDLSVKKRYPAEAPMKKLISEEISKRPSIVARLMGLEMLPIDADTKPVSTITVDKHISKPEQYASEEKQCKNISKAVHDCKEKPERRYHPQEEELQKFKKEFEAWQVKSVQKHSKVLLSSEDQTLTKSSPVYNQRTSSKGKMVIKDKDENMSVSSVPTRIVLLRPGPDCVSNNDESWASSSGTSEDRANMSDFLDEVKTRLKYEFQNKTNQEIRVGLHNRSRSSIADNEIVELGYRYNTQYTKSRSFRYGPDDDVNGDDVIIRRDELAPKNLVRSLSAPVSGTSFGKLLLEDRNILTGAQIRRKHEVVERVTVKVKKEKKEKLGLNLREKVSSFKYSFTLRGKFFGRKFHLTEESLCEKLNDVKNIMDGPTVMMNFDYQYENSTEVPPSPASVCSSVHDEIWRSSDYPSSAEKSDIPPLEQAPSQDSTSSNDVTMKEEVSEVEMVELKEEHEAKTYIRDLLVASGLYDDSPSFTNLNISDKNFEEVEGFYRDGKSDYDHKLLLDLTNEALSAMSIQRLPRGRKLLDRVWDTTQEYLYPPAENCCQSVDGLIGRDLKLLQWAGSKCKDVDILGEDIEFRILDEMIEELVKDMCSC